MNREGNRDTKNRWRTGAALAALGFATLTGMASEARADHMEPDWKEGVTFQTENKDAKISFGGRVLFDTYFTKGGERTEATLSGNPIADEVRFRELRLQTEGTIWDNTEFKIQIDFADPTKIAIKDTYVGIKDIGGGIGVRIGHFKEPFSLEELTSGRFVTFTARALPTLGFAPSRNMGIMFHNEKIMEGKASVCVGIFRETNNETAQFKTNDDLAYNLTGRLTLAPVLENKGEQVVHVGFAYTHREPPADPTDDGTVTIKVKPELAYLTETYNVATSNVDREQRMGFEAAAQFASVALQGEYYLDFLTVPGSDKRFNGWYGQASFFPTGEFRPYSPSGFKRVKPKSNVFQGGTGAIEVAIRYSNVNLIDDANGGDKGNSLAAAVNWYLNPNVAFKLNYIFADIEVGEHPTDGTTDLTKGSLHAIVFRAQADI